MTGRGKVTGHTSDMVGNWTIGAFDTKHANKKETPAMKEIVGSNEMGAHEIGKFYMKADDALISKFEEYMNKFYELGDKKFQNLALKRNIKLTGHVNFKLILLSWSFCIL